MTSLSSSSVKSLLKRPQNEDVRLKTVNFSTTELKWKWKLCISSCHPDAQIYEEEWFSFYFAFSFTCLPQINYTRRLLPGKMTTFPVNTSQIADKFLETAFLVYSSEHRDILNHNKLPSKWKPFQWSCLIPQIDRAAFLGKPSLLASFNYFSWQLS